MKDIITQGGKKFFDRRCTIISSMKIRSQEWAQGRRQESVGRKGQFQHQVGAMTAETGKRLKCISDNIGFARGVLRGEGVCLQISEPTKNTASGNSGQFHVSGVENLD